MGKRVFISYTEVDEPYAKFIGDQLEEMGHSITAMYKGLEGDFLERIKEAFEQCDNIILCFSPKYEKSPHCIHEKNVAFKMEIENRKGKVHLVKVDPYRLGDFYAVHTYIDLSKFALGTPALKSYFREEIVRRFGGNISGLPTIAIRNLPNRPSNFTGRREIIDLLHHQFNPESEEHVVQALVGVGGAGKTKIALEYAYRYLDQYVLVWFFHAEDTTILRQELSDLAKTLRLPETQSENIDHHIAALRRYFEDYDKYLIIFDNAISPNDLEDIIPANPRGNILITSKNPGWNSIANIQPIGLFSHEESIEFLEKRLKRTNEKPCFGKITHEIDPLPIAMDLAAGYMDTNQISCQDYLEVLEENSAVLDPLMKVWKPSFHQICNKSKSSISLLEYLTHFSPDEIPEEVLYPALRCTPDLSGKVNNKAGYFETLSLLLQYSLVSRDLDRKSLNMHRIVQDAVRYSMTPERKKNKACNSVEILSQLFPIKSDDPETIDGDMWVKCHQILPHAIKTAQIAEDLDVAPESRIHLYAQIASFLRELDNLKEAEVFAEKSVKIGSMHKTTIHYAISLETLARILRDQGRNNEAEILMLEAIAIEEPLHTSSDSYGKSMLSSQEKRHLAICYDGYGRILTNMGKFHEALAFYNKALLLDYEFHGKTHPKIAIRKNNIACIYGQQSKDNLEIQFLNEALKIEEEYYKGNHPHIAIRLGNLALVYERVAKKSEEGEKCLDLAKAYWKRSFTIDNEFYGPGHPQTLSRMNGLAGHFCIRKEFEKALELNNKAIEITTSEGPEGYHHGTCLIYRGNTYLAMNEYPSALKDYDDALAIMTKLRGSTSMDCSAILNNISSLKGQQEDYSSAADYLERALEIDKFNNHAKGRNYCIHLINLGYYYSQSGDHTKARSHLEPALPLIEMEFGENSQEYLITLTLFINTKIAINDLGDVPELIRKYERIKSLLNENQSD
jgi:tetratricopeptide (TPR) repeat protein